MVEGITVELLVAPAPDLPDTLVDAEFKRRLDSGAVPDGSNF
jgi:hypothetical protein